MSDGPEVEEYRIEAADARRKGVLRALALGAVLPGMAEAMEPIPSCETLPSGDAGGYDCVLDREDGNRLLFDYAGTDAGTTLIFSEILPNGDALFRSGPIDVDPTPTGPALRDLSGDGVAELLIPYGAGMVNVQTLVWQRDPDGWRAIGEVGGMGADAIELRDGLILTTERDSAAAYYEMAQRIEGDIVPVYKLYVNYADRTCRVFDDQGLAAAGLSAEVVLAGCEGRAWE